MIDIPINAFTVGLAFFIFAVVRYLVMVGAYYFIVYTFFKERFKKFKINSEFPQKKLMKNEAYWALLNKINFAVIGVIIYYQYKFGMLKIYWDINEYPLWYAIGIIPILLIIHDAYFFWSHYLMHHPRFRKISHHHIHHQSHNVTPWAAFSVHPVEGFIEVMIRPIVLMVFPLHPYTIGVFALITFSLNIIGHSGYEFFPRGYATSDFSKLNSCATFHYLHHKNGNYNFGLFLNVWDRMMGTLHPEYEKYYEKSSKSNRFILPHSLSDVMHTFKRIVKRV